MYCGWFNGYTSYYAASKALNDVKELIDNDESLEHDVNVVTCITTTVLYKNGVHQCDVYYDNMFILCRNKFDEKYSVQELEEIALTATRMKFANLDVERDCAGFSPYHECTASQ